MVGKSTLGLLERRGLDARILKVGDAFWAGRESERNDDRYSWMQGPGEDR